MRRTPKEEREIERRVLLDLAGLIGAAPDDPPYLIVARANGWIRAAKAAYEKTEDAR